jgi:hypothetical protein
MNENQSLFSTTNYMVPAGGTTHAVQVQGEFSNVPYVIDWRQYKIDNFPFQPQGVFIDNTNGTTPLNIVVGPLGWKVSCPAGEQIQTQFPAPNGQTCSITGDQNNTAQVIFVDFPVLPSGQGASNAQPVTGDVTVDNTAGNPVPVAIISGGGGGSTPAAFLRTENTNTDSRYGQLGGAVPAGFTKLRKFSINFSADISVVTAANLLIELSDDAALLTQTVFSASVYIGNVSAPVPFGGTTIDFDFGDAGYTFPSGNYFFTLHNELYFIILLSTGVITANTVWTN